MPLLKGVNARIKFNRKEFLIEKYLMIMHALTGKPYTFFLYSAGLLQLLNFVDDENTLIYQSPSV